MTEAENIRAVEFELGALRFAEELLSKALNHLHDAEHYAKQGRMPLQGKWIAEHAEALRDTTLTEIRAGITKLEAEIRP